MKITKTAAAAVLIIAGGLTGIVEGRHLGRVKPADVWRLVKRTTFGISYAEDEYAAVTMVGTLLQTKVKGRAEVRRGDGRTRVKMRLDNLPHPQSINVNYTSYVIWAITPEGEADNFGRLPVSKEGSIEIEFTTPRQSFGMIVTAEPHPVVRYPGPTIVAENLLDKDVKRQTSQRVIDYFGDPGILYGSVTGRPASLPVADYGASLLALGARLAIQIARRAGAEQHANAELQQAESRLVRLEQLRTRNPADDSQDKEIGRISLEVMKLAEAARFLAIERSDAVQTRLDAENRRGGMAASPSPDISGAAAPPSPEIPAPPLPIVPTPPASPVRNNRANAVRTETAGPSPVPRDGQTLSRAELIGAGDKIVPAETERVEPDRGPARGLDGRDRDRARRRLESSISDILKAQREERGLIVTLSDTLFDLDQATLTTEAKQSLSRLTGMLMTYRGYYRIEIEGHTDTSGSAALHQRVADGRAGSVRNQLLQAGLPQGWIISTRGLGATRPVMTNDTDLGRYLNRRVEIIITEVEPPSSK